MTRRERGRLRAGRIPGILYGGAGETQPDQSDHNELPPAAQLEAFLAVLTMNDGAKTERLPARTQYRHPFKQQVLHLDFQRVDGRTRST